MCEANVNKLMNGMVRFQQQQLVQVIKVSQQCHWNLAVLSFEQKLGTFGCLDHQNSAFLQVLSIFFFNHTVMASVDTLPYMHADRGVAEEPHVSSHAGG
jgi:hypothetical protein